MNQNRLAGRRSHAVDQLLRLHHLFEHALPSQQVFVGRHELIELAIVEPKTPSASRAAIVSLVAMAVPPVGAGVVPSDP